MINYYIPVHILYITCIIYYTYYMLYIIIVVRVIYSLSVELDHPYSSHLSQKKPTDLDS